MPSDETYGAELREAAAARHPGLGALVISGGVNEGGLAGVDRHAADAADEPLAGAARLECTAVENQAAAAVAVSAVNPAGQQVAAGKDELAAGRPADPR